MTALSSQQTTPGLSPFPVEPASQSSADIMRAELDLLRRLRAGEDAAFEELVRLHSGRLLAVARRMLRNDDDARDALQQAFLSAFKALPRFQGESRLSTWLHRIVVNTALMRMRTRSRRPEEPIENLLPRFLEDGHHVETWTEWGASVETLMEQRETCRMVRAAIDRLPESYRTVLLLRDIEELDTAEAAKALGLSANAVKIRLHRARQALAGVLSSELKPV